MAKILVVDSSAVVEAIGTRAPQLTARLADGRLQAPHVLDLEVLQALRGLVLRRLLSPQRAEYARADLDELAITRYPHKPFAERIWELRHNLTAYDAAFVALAETLDVPLVTCDARLARTRGHSARIELLGA